ncbi:hypothetical protein [Paenibacillus bouchesdurhonensis]|uniref:hypothetical protein n=1 Tax=Paenibacillus bouchesdurhonensis TaxID=1870990 RepID=UPI000DA5F6E1|nr:hypothetical protein [Paenibacillus bouchesdurhonensis]
MIYALMVLVMAMVTITFLCLMIRDKDKTIRELTDKLMSRNYTEYVSMTKAMEDPPPEIPSRKPLSWYDDPNIPDVDGDSS